MIKISSTKCSVAATPLLFLLLLFQVLRRDDNLRPGDKKFWHSLKSVKNPSKWLYYGRKLPIEWFCGGGAGGQVDFFE